MLQHWGRNENTKLCNLHHIGHFTCALFVVFSSIVVIVSLKSLLTHRIGDGVFAQEQLDFISPPIFFPGFYDRISSDGYGWIRLIYYDKIVQTRLIYFAEDGWGRPRSIPSGVPCGARSPRERCKFILTLNQSGIRLHLVDSFEF